MFNNVGVALRRLYDNAVAWKEYVDAKESKYETEIDMNNRMAKRKEEFYKEMFSCSNSDIALQMLVRGRQGNYEYKDIIGQTRLN